MSLHVVVGAGPLGRSVATKLVRHGESVKLVSRKPPELAGVQSMSADATDEAAMRNAVTGADVVHHCANVPYHQWSERLPPIWRGILEAAASAGARLVIATNLYALGEPGGALTAASPVSPCSTKGRVRAVLEAEAMAAHEERRIQVALVRGSDFYGPEVGASQLGDRFFPPLLSGKPASLVGRVDVPHSYTYLDDFAETMIAVADRDDTFGRSWIVPSAPPVTGNELREVVDSVLADHTATSDPRAEIRGMKKGMLRLAGLFVPAARELVEMYYEFDRAFVVDSSESETRLGVLPTPLDRGISQTLEWYQSQSKAQEAAPVR